jgi:carbon-monoxide dehydrogenase medium subunit
VKPAPFEYHRAESAAEATSLLAELGDDARLIAGGQSLVPMLALRLAVIPHLVDVWSIGELRGAVRDDGFVEIGAATPQAHLERDPIVAEAVPLLAAATPLIGHFQIRNRGTIGGSLAHADPAAEYPAVAVTLDAEIELRSATDTRRVAAVDFFEGFWTTALEPGELLTAVRFPVWPGRTGFAVEEFARRHGDFAVAGATAAVELADDDSIVRCAIAVFGAAAVPVRARTAEAALRGTAARDVDAEEVGHLAVGDVDDPTGDANAPAGYRMRVAAAMAGRALAGALREAGDG